LRAAAARLQQIVRLGLRARPALGDEVGDHVVVRRLRLLDRRVRAHPRLVRDLVGALHPRLLDAELHPLVLPRLLGRRRDELVQRDEVARARRRRLPRQQLLERAVRRRRRLRLREQRRAHGDDRRARLGRRRRLGVAERGAQRRDEVAEVLVALRVRPAAGAAVCASRLHE
jgi:hypothetical protein